MAKGLDYRETSYLHVNGYMKRFEEALDVFISKQVTKNHPSSMFKTWKTNVLERVYEIISVPCKIKPSIFQNKAVKKELESLQQKYIITSTDKAANNIHFTCKKMYYEILDKELLSSSTYDHFVQTMKTIL